MKSRRQLEEESREEGLKKSLFQRAKEEESDIGRENKAMAIMLKMGFKPGQALGRSEDNPPIAGTSKHPVSGAKESPELTDVADGENENSVSRIYNVKHITVPLPLDVWTGE